MWKAHIGEKSKPLILALTDGAGDLEDFGTLSGPGGTGTPKLEMYYDTGEVVTRDLITYTAEPTLYNAQHVFSDYTGIVEGVYRCRVAGHKASQDTFWPGDGFFEIKFISITVP